MTFRILTPHPHSKGASGLTVEAGLGVNGGAVIATYRVRGDVGRLRLPVGEPGARRDGLWRTTCFEAFIQAGDGPGYDEFNFAPSGEWAAYRFSGRREGMTPLGIPAPAIETCRDDGALIIKAQLGIPISPPGRAGLAAVIETADGEISWWALAHLSPDPDFHDPGSFLYELTRASAP